MTPIHRDAPTALPGLLPLFLLLLNGAAQATVAGQCSHQERRVAFVDGAAWILPPGEEDNDEDGDSGYGGGAPAESTGPALMLAFTTFRIDAGALARATDREEALRDQSWGQDAAARLELILDGGVVGQQFLWISPGTSLSYSSNEVGEYQSGTAPAAAGRVAGHYRFRPEHGQDLDCALEFDLAVLGDPAHAPPPPGVPLPVGGGEPGAVYLALNAALLAGDLDALVRLLPPQQSAELQKARDTPEFAEQLDFMQAMTPSEVRITGGRLDGDRAWLEFSGVEAGRPRLGSVEMRREQGRWRVLKESTRDAD